MTTLPTFAGSTVMQSGGLTLSPGILAVVGLAAVVVLAIVWLLTRKKKTGAD